MRAERVVDDRTIFHTQACKSMLLNGLGAGCDGEACSASKRKSTPPWKPGDALSFSYFHSKTAAP